MWKDNGLQLVMLPTKEETSLIIDDNSRTLHKLDNPKEAAWGFQQLYLLSDEEIKEGDWFLFKWSNQSLIQKRQDYNDNEIDYRCTKIITSADPSLNLPQFPSSFLEEYVKRYNSKNSLEVEVAQPIRTEKICQNCIDYKSSYHCEICNSNLDMFKNVIDTISIRFKEEKMYNRSEVEKLCGNAFDAGEAYRTGSCDLFKQIHPDKHDWIKENLK